MKKFILLVSIAVSVIGCHKERGNNNQGNNSGIIIKGSIKSSGTKSLQVKSTNALTLADAKKVLVFSKYYYKLFDINDSTFSATAQFGSGAALIFLDGNNKYIGNLSPEGLNVLPLGKLINGENTTIDLSTLTLVGNSVIPAHDPLGNEIEITPKEINALKAIDAYYEAIAKNIDANNNEIPDVIEHKQLVIYTISTIFGGHWGFNETPPTKTDSAHYYVNYMVEFAGGDSLSFSGNSIAVTGPAEDPYNDIKLWWYTKGSSAGGDRGFISSFCRETQAEQGAPWGSAFLPFKQGTYTLTLDGSRNFSLYYSNIDMQYNLFIVVPTLHTNTDGKLVSISFEYMLPNGTPIDPGNVLTNVMVQLCDNRMNQFYVNNQKLTSVTGFDELKFDTPLDISPLFQIDLWYDDLLGNQYDLIWR